MNAIELGRDVCSDLAQASEREWLITNGIGGYGCGTLSGMLTRCYHGWLVAALKPPLGRTLLLAKLDETVEYLKTHYPLSCDRWAGGTTTGNGYRHLERFCLEGTTPTWHYACADAHLTKRIWMAPGENTTYIQYRLDHASAPLTLKIKALVNHRNHHHAPQNQPQGQPQNQLISTRAHPHGLKITASDAANPFYLLGDRGQWLPTEKWYEGYFLGQEHYRGLPYLTDHLHGATLRTTLRPGQRVTILASTEPFPLLDSQAAFTARQTYEQTLIAQALDGEKSPLKAVGQAVQKTGQSPALNQLILAADQFIVDRPFLEMADLESANSETANLESANPETTNPETARLETTIENANAQATETSIAEDLAAETRVIDTEGVDTKKTSSEDAGNVRVSSQPPFDSAQGLVAPKTVMGKTVLAGYPWFGDWGRDTMIALPGLTLATGRPAIARTILRTFARYLDQGMLPNAFPEANDTPGYNTVDAILWYFEALRAYVERTQDDALLAELFPKLEETIDWHLRGTRYNIHLDETDGLIVAGEAGSQLTWMDAKVDDWVVTPRMGKPVEINALWHNALLSMAEFCDRLGQPSEDYHALAGFAAASFPKFWNPETQHCYDVIDGPTGPDAALRPNQLFAVSLRHGPPLPVQQQKAIVDSCAQELVTSHGLRSLSQAHSEYVGGYGGDRYKRDGAYHQGTVWGWLMGPFVEAHLKVYNNPAAARQFLQPLIQHLNGGCVGNLSEIFDGNAPFAPRGTFAQAWTVAEVLRVLALIEQREIKPSYEMAAKGTTA